MWGGVGGEQTSDPMADKPYVVACSQATRINHFGAVAAGLEAGPLDEGAVNAVRLSLLGTDGESGTFTRLEGKDGFVPVSW